MSIAIWMQDKHLHILLVALVNNRPSTKGHYTCFNNNNNIFKGKSPGFEKNKVHVINMSYVDKFVV